jgi:4-hydroxy-4-methyl-2-oxoglutarate aldolase
VSVDKVVVRATARADQQVVEALGKIGTATVHEAAGQTGLMSASIRPIQRGARIAGSAVTVLCPKGDNLMVHASVEIVRPGDVLVVVSPGDYGMVGELLAISLRKHGCIGVVADCGVRDKHDLNEMRWPAWARLVHAQGTQKNAAGSVNVPITCGGQTVNPGDIVVADDDGVCVVQRANAAEVLDAARARIDKEAGTRKYLEGGELGIDYYGFRQRLKDLGVTYVDDASQSPEA